jgi:hypothetical protein
MAVTRKKFLAGAAGVAAALIASRGASAQTYTRGEDGSARNIAQVRRALEGLIDQLQHDRHDFGGYRIRAIENMRRARADLMAALQWDATHAH